MVRKAKAAPNNLRMIRTTEGLKITELAELADVSTKTIAGLEYRNRNTSPEMKHRVVNGLNRHPRRKQEYTFKNVFPNDLEV